MSSKNPVLPNFFKVILFTMAATSSLSAFAGHHEEAVEKVGDLKEMASEAESKMDMIEGKKDMVEGKMDMVEGEMDASDMKDKMVEGAGTVEDAKAAMEAKAVAPE